MATKEVEATTMAVDHPKKAAAGDAKPKKVKAKKASTHPPFFEMVSDAIVTLKERSGSSQYAIQKFAEEKHKQLPPNFRKQLLTQLKKFAASGKLVKVKNSYKLPATKAPAAKKSAVSTKPKPATAANKSTAKKAVSKVTKAVTKPKAKTVAKPKSAASKPKAASVKRKAVKPKAKPAKVAKKSATSSPSSKKAPTAAKTTKKAAAPVKKAVAPLKKAGTKPKKVKKLSSVKSPAKGMSAKKATK